MRKKNKRERSPAFQEIMGKIPPWVIRWGMSVVFVVLILLIFISWVIKYPEKAVVNLKIIRQSGVMRGESEYYAKGYVREEDYVRVKEGMKVNIKLKGYPYNDYGMLEGEIEKKRYIRNKGFEIKVKLKERLTTSFKKKIRYYEGMSGEGEIIVKNERVFEKMLKRKTAR